jgi:hypothetical protein
MARKILVLNKGRPANGTARLHLMAVLCAAGELRNVVGSNY